MTPSIADNPPGPNDPEEDETLSMPVTIQMMSSSGSDSEDEWNQGYELLPQEPETETSLIEQDPSPSSWPQPAQATNSILSVAETLQFQEQALASLSSESFLMDQDHIEKIKAAMAGFSLPSSSIPPWASIVPEEQWKDHLLMLMSARMDQNSCPIHSTEVETATMDSVSSK